MSDEIIFRIDTDMEGKEVSLDHMSVETAQILKSFIDHLSALAKLQEDPSKVQICVRRGSAATGIRCPDAAALLTTNRREERKILGYIQSTIKANGFGYSVLVSDGKAVPKDVTKKFVEQKFVLTRAPRAKWTEEVLFLTGEFDLPGGKVTNFHLRVSDESYVVGCSRAQVRRYKSYDNVRVSILKRKKEGQRPNYTLIDFYVSQASYDDYSFLYKSVKFNTSLDRYDKLHDFIVENYNKKDFTKIAKLMKLYQHELADRGLVRTILMTLKPVMRPQDRTDPSGDKMAPVIRLFSKMLDAFQKSKPDAKD